MLPVSVAPAPGLNEQYNTYEQPTHEFTSTQSSEDKLGEREKNSDNGMNVGSAPPVDEFSATLSNQYDPEEGRYAHLRRYKRPVTHAFILCLFTGWWMASLILHHHDKNWVVPFLLWLAITIRIITYYIPIRYVSDPIKWTWQHTGVAVYNRLPEKSRTPLGALVAIAAIIVGSMASEETADNTRANRAISLLGLAVILFTFWLTSRHRKAINWRTVIVGMLAQYIVGLFVLRTGVGYDIFKFIADRAGDLLGFARDGVAFMTTPDVAELPWFFFGVLPAIICELFFTDALATDTHRKQSLSPLSRLCTILGSSSGLCASLQALCSGPWVLLVPRPLSLPPRHSSVRESLPCWSDHSCRT